jgi:hypothetical protein
MIQNSCILLVVLPSYAKQNTNRNPGPVNQPASTASCASHTAIQASGEREPWADMSWLITVNTGNAGKY